MFVHGVALVRISSLVDAPLLILIYFFFIPLYLSLILFTIYSRPGHMFAGSY